MTAHEQDRHHRQRRREPRIGQFALDRLNAPVTVTTDPEVVRNADRVILPGVGMAADAMKRLRAAGLVEVIPTLKQPVLGICVGMQLLFEGSEEGNVECLGILPGTVRRLNAEPGRPVPHMGWNTLVTLRDDPLLEGITGSDYVYFVHSYAAPVSDVTLARNGLRRRRCLRPSVAATSGARSSIRNVRLKPARASSQTFSG